MATMAFRGSVLALALAATAARDLPAPMSDFYLEGPLGHESNFSYMNTATLRSKVPYGAPRCRAGAAEGAVLELGLERRDPRREGLRGLGVAPRCRRGALDVGLDGRRIRLDRGAV
jgi:hypothetical protein